MKKSFITLLMICLAFAMQAQKNAPRPRLSPEEFRAKQEAFITKKAELSKEEAKKFFPVFFELQDKKKALNDKAWKGLKAGKNPQTTDAKYEKIINDMLDTRIKVAELDKEYYQKFKKVLSPKKIYKVQHAEMRFHRELLRDVNKCKDKKDLKK